MTARDEFRDRLDHPVVPLVPLARIDAADGQQHLVPGKAPGGAQRRAVAGRERVADRIRHDDSALGRDVGPGEHGGARVTRHAQHQIGRLDREPPQPRWRRPGLDPVRLDDQPGAREPGNRRCQRRQMQMAAEHDIRPALERRYHGRRVRSATCLGAGEPALSARAARPARPDDAARPRSAAKPSGRPGRRGNRGCIARSRRFRRTRR